MTFWIWLWLWNLRKKVERKIFGKPSLTVREPFDVNQASEDLNLVIRRGTFEEINVYIGSLCEHGHTAHANGTRWFVIQLPQEETEGHLP